MKYPKDKFKKVKGAVQGKIFNLTDSSDSDNSGEDGMMAQLKEKFHITVKKDENIHMLKILQKRWPITKI